MGGIENSKLLACFAPVSNPIRYVSPFRASSNVGMISAVGLGVPMQPGGANTLALALSRCGTKLPFLVA